MSYNAANENILCSPLLEQMPGWMFIKNTKFEYTSTTLRSALLCGFKNQHDKYGRSDYELKCKAAESAAFFQEQDNAVISKGQAILFLQLNQYADDQTHIFLTKKIPLKNQGGNIVGVCGIVEEISQPIIAEAIFKLANLGNMNDSNSASKKNFQIDANDVFYRLSTRESELIFYFIRGFSIKEIGLLMRQFPQTIESDLEIVKNKFNCNSLQDLLNYCLAQRVSNIIPHIMLQRCFNQPIDSILAKPAMGLLSDLNPNLLSIEHQKLSKRQKQCLYYLSEGLSTKEIARKLSLSPRTIEHYIETIKVKFHCRTRYELIKKLSRTHLL